MLALPLALALLALCPVLLQAREGRVGAEDAGAPPEPVVLRADAASVVLEWQAPAVSQRQMRGDDGRAYVALETPGWVQTDAPGRPRLPFAVALVAVPPEGEVTLQVQVLERTMLTLAAPPLPARRPTPAGSPPVVGQVWALEERAYSPDEAAFRRANGLVEFVRLEELGWQRGNRLVQIIFSPLRFDPAGPALEVAQRVRVELSFAGRADGTGVVRADDPFITMLQRSVVNPAQVTEFVCYPGPADAGLPAAQSVGAAALTGSGAPSDTQYLIITHPNFVTATAPLAARRAFSDGLNVYVTTTQAIYVAYSGGVASATALRDYISDTYHSASPPNLDYVLLVGDGSEHITGTQYVPPYMIPDPWGYDPNGVASDNRFATVVGADHLADVFIGRLPVRSAAQATTVVDKILAYGQAPLSYPWNQYALFFADNPEPGAPFHLYSDNVYSTLPVTVTGQRVYYCTANCNQPHLYTNIDTAHSAVMNWLDFGALLSSYQGHSSWHQWATERLFHLDDVASLDNGGALPVFLQMTCYTSRFAHPTTNTLDESLLRRAGGGAVATWGCTGLGSSSGHGTLQYRFFEAVFKHGETELGAAIAFAKLDLPSNDEGNGLRDTFTLLGDPAMRLNLTVTPWSSEFFLPLTMRNG